MLRHLEGDAVAGGKLSLAWQVSAGSGELIVARAGHRMLQRGPVAAWCPQPSLSFCESSTHADR